jgi:excisionase family DNA binding protein
MENYLTSKQVQELFKVDRITVYRMLQDGRLKGIKIGNQWRFSQSEVERLLNGISLPVESEETESVFPVHCVQTIQNLYSSLSKANALVVNCAGEAVTKTSKQSNFCKLMQSSPSGLRACQESWKSFFSEGTKNGNAFTCHAGLSYFGAPILSQNKVQGLFLSGQFQERTATPAEAQERCARLSKQHQLNATAVEAAFAEIPTLSQEQKEYIADQPQAAATAVESILTERSAFMDRLQKIANLTQNI